MMFAQTSTRPTYNPRVVTVPRPLVIGAPYLVSFECLTPIHFSAMDTRTELFRLYDMKGGEWTEKKTRVTLIREDFDTRRWRIERDV